MDKKVALVVGGSGGIGSEIVKALAANGIQVCFTYHSKENAAEVLQKSYKGSVSGYNMDLFDAASVKNTIYLIFKDYGSIDVVVFSATLPIKNKNILMAEWKDYEEHLELQTKGLFLIVQSLKERIESKRKLKFIVILTEYCIGKPPAGLSHYIQAKYSLMGLAKSMAVDLARYNCTVNMISPGMVDTALLANLPPKLVEMTAEANPLKRIATPRDVANLISFLASDGSDYLNGVNITVNGGNVML